MISSTFPLLSSYDGIPFKNEAHNDYTLQQSTESSSIFSSRAPSNDRYLLGCGFVLTFLLFRFEKAFDVGESLHEKLQHNTCAKVY